MKKIILLILTIMYSCVSLAQQNVAFNDSIGLSLPKGTVKITREQAKAHVHNKFKDDRTASVSVNYMKNEHTYVINDVLVSFTAGSRNLQPGYLTDTKTGLDGLYKSNDTYSSNLNNDGRKKILTINYSIGDVEYFRFFCSNQHNSIGINGVLEFDKNNENAAKAILDHIVNSIKFKE